MLKIPHTKSTKELMSIIEKHRKEDEKIFFIELDLGQDTYAIYKNKCVAPKYSQMMLKYDFENKDVQYMLWTIESEESCKHLSLLDEQFYENNNELSLKRIFAKLFDMGRLKDMYTHIIDDNIGKWISLKQIVQNNKQEWSIQIN